MARTSNRRRKASKGKEESSNHSISNKGVKKLFKKKKLSRKIDETFKSKVAQSTSIQELVSVPNHASVTTSLPLYNDRKKHEDIVEKKHSGFIFMCNGKTKSECYEYRVFGLPKGKIEVVKNISHDTKLFLFDTNLRLLYGIYQASSEGALDLEPTAFNGQFQAQVKFKIFKECLPLPESDFKHAIEDNYDSRRKFRQELSSEQVKSLISLFRPFAKKRPSAKKSRVHGHVASQPSFRSTQSNKVVRSYPPENLSSRVPYLPILVTRPEHDVHHGQYDPFESGLQHVSHSQVQPGFVRVESPPRHVEAYHPGHAHDGYFTEKSLRYPPDSYESFRTTIQTNDNGDHRYGCQYHASQSLSSRDVTLKDYCAPGYHSNRRSPTTTHTAPLSQARLSPHHASQSLSSRDVTLGDYYAPGYYSERLPPTTTHTAPLSQARLSPYHASQSLSGRDIPLVDYYAPGYHSKRRSPTTTHTAPLSQARLSPYHASQSLSSRDVPLVDYYAPGYYSERLPPTTTHIAPLSQARSSPYRPPNRLPSPYRLENRLRSPYRPKNRLHSPYRSQNRLPSPHHSYYSAVASEDRGRAYGSPQGQTSFW